MTIKNFSIIRAVIVITRIIRCLFGQPLPFVLQGVVPEDLTSDNIELRLNAEKSLTYNAAIISVVAWFLGHPAQNVSVGIKHRNDILNGTSN